jgi:hypothetical protein
MRTSESIKEIASALAKAQAKMRPASKDAINPHFKSKYADLSAIVEACREPLSVNGIAIVQDATLSDRGADVTTRLLHSSGEWLEFGPLTVPMGKSDAHGVGSAITYAKRYGLSAAVGIAADEDDDGNGAASQAPQRAVAAFDEKGYQSWLVVLARTAMEGGYTALIEDVREGRPEFQDRLRADKVAWAALKAASPTQPVSA